MDEMKYLDLERTAEVHIPEGLEERLSMKIDQWAKDEERHTIPATETKTPTRSISARFRLYRNIAIAACLSALICIAGITTLDDKVDIAHRDTFDNPELARIEAEKALYLLAYNLDKGMRHLEKAEDITAKTRHTLNNTLTLK